MVVPPSLCPPKANVSKRCSRRRRSHQVHDVGIWARKERRQVLNIDSSVSWQKIFILGSLGDGSLCHLQWMTGALFGLWWLFEKCFEVKGCLGNVDQDVSFRCFVFGPFLLGGCENFSFLGRCRFDNHISLGLKFLPVCRSRPLIVLLDGLQRLLIEVFVVGLRPGNGTRGNGLQKNRCL